MAPDWAALPTDILDSVLERLVSLSDYVRFSVVCMPWFYVAKGQQSRRRAIMPKCPMLMISTDKEETWNVYNAMDNKNLDLEVQLPNMPFCGSSKGWLVAIDVNYVITLINPFYRVKGRERGDSVIRLPPLAPLYMDEQRKCHVERFSNCDYFVWKVTISADPILSANDCIVLVMYKGGPLAFIRISKDVAWTYTKERFTHSMAEVIWVEDKCYFVTLAAELFSFNITPEAYSEASLVAPSIRDEESMHRRIYIAHANERDLLMVQKYVSVGADLNDPTIIRRTMKVLVFRFDFAKCKWTEVNTLGDVSLLLSDNSSESVLLSSNSGCLPNCIYFTHDYDALLRYKGVPHCDFDVYSLEYQCFSPIDTTNVANLVKDTGRGRPIWVIPTFKL